MDGGKSIEGGGGVEEGEACPNRWHTCKNHVLDDYHIIHKCQTCKIYIGHLSIH